MEHFNNVVKLFGSFKYKHDTFTVFEDFLYMSASAFANSVDKVVYYEEREAEYLRRINKYSKEDQLKFPQILGELVMCFEVGGPNDYLGKLFMDLDLGNKYRGQFFTPYPVSKMMASITFSKEDIEKCVAEKGYMTLSEPTCGAGGMVIAAYEAVYKLGFNPQQVLRVVSQDIDIKAVLMTFIQSSILGIDNTVILGNTLTNEQKEVWRTPGRFIRLIGMMQSLNNPVKVTKESLDKYDNLIDVQENGQYVLAL